MDGVDAYKSPSTDGGDACIERWTRRWHRRGEGGRRDGGKAAQRRCNATTTATTLYLQCGRLVVDNIVLLLGRSELGANAAVMINADDASSQSCISLRPNIAAT
jgi:hypothetical protein